MLNNLKEKIDVKTILIVLLTIAVIVLSFSFSIFVMKNVTKTETNGENTSKIVDKNIKYKGTITRVEDGMVYFKADGSDEEESTPSNCAHAKEGDTIEYRINENGEKYSFTLVTEENGKTVKYQIFEYTQTNTTTGSNLTTSVSSANPGSNVSTDDLVLNYIKEENNRVSSLNNTEDNKKKAKEYFTTLVDFIFYGGKIQGHTFNELSTSAKEKTIYLTLKIDGIIDKNIPGYKQTLGDSYKNAKKELLANYTDYSAKVCAENKELCSDLKKDTEDLKKSLNITWSIVKDIYNEIIKPAGKGSVEKLAEWYEVWKNA